MGVRVLLALLVLGLSSSLAAPAIPDDLSNDPLDRGALIALPGIYQVEARFTVGGLSTRLNGEQQLDTGGPVTSVDRSR